MIRRRANGTFIVEVYDPSIKNKRYVKAAEFGLSAPRTEREARKLERKALDLIEKRGHGGDETCDSFGARWTRDYPRGESTNKHNAERVKKFGEDFKGRTLRSVTRREAREWAWNNRARLASVRAMFSDAQKDELISENPFTKLGFKQSRGRRDIVVLKPDEVYALSATAKTIFGEWGENEFGPMIVWAAFTCMRPGEVFIASRKNFASEDVYDVTGQWHSKLGKETGAKHGSNGLIYVPPPALHAIKDRVQRMDDLLFRTRYGKGFTAGTLFYAWDKVRQRANRPDLDWYELRHAGASYLLNDLEMEPWVVAEQLRHTDGGALVTTLYGHPDRRRAIDRIRQAYGTGGALEERGSGTSLGQAV